MIPMLAPMMSEIQEEGAITKRVLDRVPADKLSWRPHPKSMSLGELALHVATIPGSISRLAQLDEFDVATANFNPASPGSAAELIPALDASVQAAQEYLCGLSESSAMGSWRLTAHGSEVFTKPRVTMMRALMLNHWYHHRGQLSVYLRLLEVPVPTIYGPSADDNPFA